MLWAQAVNNEHIISLGLKKILNWRLEIHTAILKISSLFLNKKIKFSQSEKSHSQKTSEP